jgi:sulfite exporter TauE/SafE
MEMTHAASSFSLLAPLLVGLAGGLHCAGMCGGIVAALSLSRPPTRPRYALSLLLYHSGRIGSYVLLGVLFGLVGGIVAGAPLRMAQQGVTVVAGAIMLVFALQVGGFIPETRLLSAIRLPSSPLRNAADGRLSAWLAVGVMNGLLPCGLVYAALAMALAAATPVAGGIVMLLFGLGTIPPLLGVAFAARMIDPARRGVALKIGAILVALYGVWYMVKPFVMAGKMGHG